MIMKYLPIVPIAGFEVLKEEKIKNHMVLVQHLKNEKYKNFYLEARKEEGSFIILDNGQFEGHACSDGELIKAADLLKPDVVVCPDAFLDGQKTIQKTMEFMSKLKGDEPYELMAVPQGEDHSLFNDCFMNFALDSRIKWIGLSKLGCGISKGPFRNRGEVQLEILDQLIMMDKVGETGKKIHWLGCNCLYEIATARSLGVHSIDTCLPWLYKFGWNQLPWEKRERCKTPLDLMNQDFPKALDSRDLSKRIFKRNIRTIQLLGGERECL